MRNPNEIVAEALAAIQGCAELSSLEQVKAAYLGKSGSLTELLKSLGAMPAEERKAAGAPRARQPRSRLWAPASYTRDRISTTSSRRRGTGALPIRALVSASTAGSTTR